MSNANKVINAPVRTSADVASVLGVASNNVGYLCSNKHGQINKWSRFKPVHIAGGDSPNRNGEWWKGTLGTCGLTPVYVRDYHDIPSCFTDKLKKSGWDYTPPSGTSSSPYRLADFNKYKHDAMPPFAGMTVTDKCAVGKNFNATFTIGLQTSDKTIAGSISMDDIKAADGVGNLGDYYYGVIITDKNGNFKLRATANKTDPQITFALTSNFAVGQTYNVYPFLSKYEMPLNQTSDPSNNYVYPIPCVTPKTFNVVSATEYAGIDIQINATWDLSNNGVTVNVTVSSEQAITVNGGYVWLKYDGSATTASTTQPQKQISSFTIAANGSHSLGRMMFSGLDSTKHNLYKVYVQLNTSIGYYNKTEAIQESFQPINPE